jgi:mRNA interferase RelE/StbE
MNKIFKVTYSNEAREIDIPYLLKADKSLMRNIKESINEKLLLDPITHGKPLRFQLKGVRSFRVGDYRVLFLLDNEKKEIHILSVKHRKEVYE